MRTKKIHIPIYEYDVLLVQVDDVEGADSIQRALRRYNLGPDIMAEIIENITNEVDGGGITCFNTGYKMAITVLYPCTDADFYEATVDHEKRHIVDDVLEHCGVNDKEAAAYLSGWLTTKFKV